MKIIIVGEKIPCDCKVLENHADGYRIIEYYFGEDGQLCNGEYEKFSNFPSTREELKELFNGQDAYITDDEDLLLFAFCLMNGKELEYYKLLYPITFQKFEMLHEKTIYEALELLVRDM